MKHLRSNEKRDAKLHKGPKDGVWVPVTQDQIKVYVNVHGRYGIYELNTDDGEFYWSGYDDDLDP